MYSRNDYFDVPSQKELDLQHAERSSQLWRDVRKGLITFMASALVTLGMGNRTGYFPFGLVALAVPTAYRVRGTTRGRNGNSSSYDLTGREEDFLWDGRD